MALEKILVVGKDSQTQKLVRPYTQQLFAADEIHDVWDMIDSVEPHLILLDPKLTQTQVHDFLRSVEDKSLSAPVVVIGDTDDKDNVQNLLNMGAYDYIKVTGVQKRIGQLIDKIRNKSRMITADSRFFSQDCPSSVSIVGKSEATDKTLRMIKIVAKSTCNPVLIVGETGTGKELAARAVHVLRHGSDCPFVALNCAALTATLLESELFGHVKGSFTSADRDKTGLLELAGNGTIFLDEVSEMPIDLQAKLLRVLQEKTFRKVGGTQDLHCSATIIASSNQNLHEAVETNKFRRDLYYRLSICPIVLAPLRVASRKDDIPLLAEYFIQNSQICPEKAGKIKGLTNLAIEMLQQHAWPGNVRELRNVIERAIMLESSDKIGTAHLMVNPENHMDTSYSPPKVGLKDFSLERAEKELVAKALKEAGWQKTRAAALLGITRATLYAKVKQYNITEPNKKEPVMA